MTLVELTRGDKNYFLQFKLEDSEGMPVDLSGPSTTVKIKMQKYGTSSLVLDKTGKITSPKEGRCRFPIGEELLNESGDYSAEVEISWLDQAITLTATGILVHITKDLPRV